MIRRYSKAAEARRRDVRAACDRFGIQIFELTGEAGGYHLYGPPDVDLKTIDLCDVELSELRFAARKELARGSKWTGEAA